MLPSCHLVLIERAHSFVNQARPFIDLLFVCIRLWLRLRLRLLWFVFCRDSGGRLRDEDIRLIWMSVFSVVFSLSSFGFLVTWRCGDCSVCGFVQSSVRFFFSFLDAPRTAALGGRDVQYLLAAVVLSPWLHGRTVIRAHGSLDVDRIV